MNLMGNSGLIMDSFVSAAFVAVVVDVLVSMVDTKETLPTVTVPTDVVPVDVEVPMGWYDVVVDDGTALSLFVVRLSVSDSCICVTNNGIRYDKNPMVTAKNCGVDTNLNVEDWNAAGVYS